VGNFLFIAGIMGDAKVKSVDSVLSLSVKLGFGQDNRWDL
jgi:hypothetical protein